MAENYKFLYEQTKKMLTMYQDEIVPGLRKIIEDLEKKQESPGEIDFDYAAEVE